MSSNTEIRLLRESLQHLSVTNSSTLPDRREVTDVMISDDSLKTSQKVNFLLAPDLLWSLLLNTITGLSVLAILLLSWAIIKYRARIIDG